jgi:hypothetical protein
MITLKQNLGLSPVQRQLCAFCGVADFPSQTKKMHGEEDLLRLSFRYD